MHMVSNDCFNLNGIFPNHHEILLLSMLPDAHIIQMPTQAPSIIGITLKSASTTILEIARKIADSRRHLGVKD